MFDSLPYYDRELEEDPVLKQKVERALAKELGTIPSELHPDVPPPVELFKDNPLLAAEIKRIEAGEPFPTIDTIRYQLPGPSSAPGTDDEWQVSLKNAYAQLEHQRLRQANLTLMQTYGANAWRVHNYVQEPGVIQAEKALEDLKQQTVEVNRERKNQQTKIGTQLNMLEAKWTELISNVLQIELANVALDAEVNNLNRREAELADSL